MDPKLINSREELFNFYNKSLKDKVEIEARFGFFDKTFEPKINYEQYKRLYNFFSSKKEFYNMKEKNQKIIQYENDIKEIIENKKSIFMEKKKIKTFDIKEYGVRIAFSSEKYIDSVDKKKLKEIRKKERLRVSFTYKDMFVFDLDRTSDGNMSIELESSTDFEAFMKNINLLLKIIQDSELVISEKEKSSAFLYYKNSFAEMKNSFIGIQPETLTLEKLIKEEDYACTKKLDGKRFVMFAFDKQCYLMSNNLQDFKKIPYFCSLKENFLIDGEFFLGNYYAFDLVSTEQNIVNRLEYIEKIFEKCKIYDIKKFKTLLHIKEYFYGNLYNSMSSLKDSLNNKYEDGIIVVKTKPDYFNSFPLKWKKLEKLTIDFLIKKREGIFSFYVQDKDNKLTLFAKNEVPEKDYSKYKTNDIVESSFKDGKWLPLHIRVDKKKPNFITVAEDNLKAIKNPFNFEKIKYYSSRSKAVFYHLRRFHNFIKRTTLEKYAKNKEALLDLASGKGGDFGKYRDVGVKYVEAYEIDPKSIEISKSRIASILNDKKNSIMIEVHQKDLNKSSVDSKYKFDVIVCNFAFHYFFNKLEHFIEILTKNSKKGTKVILTFFDSSKIVEHDNSNSKIVRVREDEIDVYIKDSVLNKPTREHIVDKQKVIDSMKEKGFEVVTDKNFQEFYESWTSKGNSLSDEEKLFSFMNTELVFEMI